MVLNRESFIRVLKKFADSTEDVEVKRDDIICQISGEIISLHLSDDGERLLCSEGGAKPVSARAWIISRLAKLEMLARRILSNVKDDRHFISVPSTYIPFDEDGSSGSTSRSKTAEAIFEDLKSCDRARTTAIYLLSEAGDGKSMVMDRLARMVADSYLKGDCNFLFLPISLEGRPFLRIDDLVIGILTNKYRFREYYYEAIIELMKLDLIVLGLDGFEEIVVEGREERVISSLTELLKRIDSKGRLVISARKAFYDYAARKQVGLLDALRKYEVSFPAYRLSQWGAAEFCEELETFGFSGVESRAIYDDLRGRMTETHPMLVRPVLARRFVEIIADERTSSDSELNFINEITKRQDPQAVLDDFVKILIERESKNKWYITSGPEKGLPLIKIADHYFYLESLAEEMWNMSVEVFPEDFIQEWMGIVCEIKQVSPARTSDCRLKIIQHALLVGENGRYSFCHEEFRRFFLGRQIAKYVVDSGSCYSLTKILDVNILDVQTVDSAVFAICATVGIASSEVKRIVQNILAAKDGYARNSNVGQNVGALVLKYLAKIPEHERVELWDLHISECATTDGGLHQIDFSDCHIEGLSMRGGCVRDVRFERCTILAVSIDEKTALKDVIMDDQSVPSRINLRESEIFNPEKVKSMLARHGVEFETESGSDPEFEDECLTAFIKITRMFYKATAVTEKTLRIKFGAHWSKCESIFVPRFKKEGLIYETTWSGGGTNVRYKLGVHLSVIQEAYEKCDGNFAEFAKLCRQMKDL